MTQSHAAKGVATKLKDVPKFKVCSYLIFETKVQVWKHVKAWRQKLYAGGHNRELPLFSLSRVSHTADDITTANLGCVLDEGFFRLVQLGIGHNLEKTKKTVKYFNFLKIFAKYT